MQFLSGFSFRYFFYLKYIKHEVTPPSAQFLTESVDENQLINLNWSGLETTLFLSWRNILLVLLSKLPSSFYLVSLSFVLMYPNGCNCLWGARLIMGPIGAKRSNCGWEYQLGGLGWGAVSLPVGGGGGEYSRRLELLFQTVFREAGTGKILIQLGGKAKKHARVVTQPAEAIFPFF